MFGKEIQLKDGKTCIFRQPLEDDAQNILDYLNRISSETDFITYGKGEMNCTLEEEQRFITVGIDFLGRLLVVIYTYRGDKIRLISARKATRKESKDYAKRI